MQFCCSSNVMIQDLGGKFPQDLDTGLLGSPNLISFSSISMIEKLDGNLPVLIMDCKYLGPVRGFMTLDFLSAGLLAAFLKHSVNKLETQEELIYYLQIQVNSSGNYWLLGLF